MNQKKATILFVISGIKTNAKGLCPLYCRITLNKERKQFSTGLFVNPKQWESKLQTLSEDDANSNYINGQIQQVQNKLNNIILVFQLQDAQYTLNDVFDKYLGKEDKKTEGVVKYYKVFLSKLKKLVGLQLKENTYNKFVYVGNHLEAYVKLEYQKDVPLDDLTENFLNGFIYYLIVEKKQAQITINKTVQRFRTAIKQAISEGYLIRDPFVLYRPKKTRKEVVFLTADDLYALENYNFKQRRLTIIKNLFIFCCYTGLAYREMAELRKKNIQLGFDGCQWIKMVREKTHRPLSIPILPKAQEVIDLYISEDENIFPSVSNQMFNSYLKEIAEIVGIEKTLTHHIARKTFASTILLYNNVPMEIVSELLGHSSIMITQESYGKIVQKKVSQVMIDLSKTLK